MESYYFALIAKGIQFCCEVTAQQFKVRHADYFIEGDIGEPFKEEEAVCSLQSCFCDAKLLEGILKVSTKLPESGQNQLQVLE